MSKRILSVLALIVPSALPACAAHGSGVLRSEPRPVAEFDAIEVHGAVNAVVTAGEAPSVHVDCDDNLVPRIRTEVRGRTLHVKLDEGAFSSGMSPSGKCEVAIAVPRLQAIGVFGSGSATVGGVADGLTHINSSGSSQLHLADVRGGDVAVSVTGGGTVAIDALSSTAVDVQVTGSGQVTLAGRTTATRIRSQGTGDIHARSLLADDADVDVGGSSGVDVFARRNAKIAMTGASKVVLVGHPQQVSRDTFGSGSLRVE